MAAITTSRAAYETAQVECPVLPPLIDPVEAAKEAGLRHVSDHEPGITRRKVGKAFAYFDPGGDRIHDEREVARIQQIVIPPAWTDVWICTSSRGHLQATGRDDRGRKQYRYHQKWREVRDESKYHRLLEFGKLLPKIRKQVDRDLRLAGLPREKVLAAIVDLLEQTLIRVGNDEYARTNDSYGLTTMRDEHVQVTTGSVRFSFRGKSGKAHEIGLRDRRLSKIVRRCRDLPGQTLFQHLDESGNTHSVGSADVNDYLRSITGREFTAKDIRTWFGTVMAAGLLAEVERGESERERKHQVVETIAEVARALGNTPSVCRKCYVHPVVLDAFESGQLRELRAQMRRNNGTTRTGYSLDERLVLKLLETQG